jgi:hypothetical protein
MVPEEIPPPPAVPPPKEEVEVTKKEEYISPPKKERYISPPPFAKKPPKVSKEDVGPKKIKPLDEDLFTEVEETAEEVPSPEEAPPREEEASLEGEGQQPPVIEKVNALQLRVSALEKKIDLINNNMCQHDQKIVTALKKIYALLKHAR